MQLTHEQQTAVDAIAHLDNHLVINAFAGTGKTTTLKAIAEAYPQYTFLYLAFNRSVKEEATQKFPSNVKVYTTHGLAYKWYVSNIGTPHFDYDALRPYNIATEFFVPYNIASGVVSVLHDFFNSIDLDIDDITYEHVRKFRDRYDSPSYAAKKISSIAKDIYKQMINQDRPIVHDFYLKYASEQSSLYNLFEPYDFILLDEAQDTNPVVFKILLNSGKPIIAVGDVHQKIYGFRNAIDVMTRLKNQYDAKVLYLTESFRFPQQIADLAYELLLLKTKDEDLPPIKGRGPKDSKSKTKAYITRTNAEIIKQIARMDENHDFYTYRTPSEIFHLPMAIASVFFDYTPPIRIPDNLIKFVSCFDSFGDLKEYAEDAKDIEVKKSADIANDYRHRLTELYRLLRKKNRKRKGLCILTAHTSKGLEFGSVVMGQDWEWRPGNKSQQILEEYNLLYVALTRAIHTLHPNDIIKQKLKLGENFFVDCSCKTIDELF